MSIGLQEQKIRNKSLTDEAIKFLSDELGRILVPGYHGSVEVCVCVQDGIAQVVKKRIEKLKK